MKISVHNVTGVERAEFALASPITLIAGENAAGKSSLLGAIGRTLAGLPLPLSVKKKDSAVMLKAGTKEGSVVITTPNGEVRADYPKADYSVVTGAAPRLGSIAAGLKNFSALSSDDRAVALLSALKAAATKEDVSRELTKAGIDDKKAKSVLDFLGEGKDLAWDSTAKIYADMATKAKGLWRAYSGVNWGSSVAQGWKPEGFTEDLLTIPREELKQAVTDAEAARDKAIAAEGVDDETTQKLQSLVESIPTLDAKVEAGEKSVQEADLVVQAAQQTRNALPTASDNGNGKCPCCEAPLRIHRLDLTGTEYQISKVEQVPAKEKSARLTAIAQADGDLANAKDKLTGARTALNAAKEELRLAYAAEDRLKAAREAKEAAGLATSEVSVQSATEAKEAAEKRLALSDAFRKASAAQEDVVVSLKIAEILGPDGVRKAKLIGHLDLLNKQLLRPITEAGQLPDVSVTTDLDIQVNGRPFEFCSGSEQWLADTVIRLAIAKSQNAPVVIIDAADILDMGRKNGLFDAIENVGLPVILGMTVPGGIAKCWDFGSADVALGASYWMDGGVLKPLADAIPMKAAA